MLLTTNNRNSTNMPVSVDLLRSFERSDWRPEEWTTEDAERAASRYYRFLLLAAKYKNQPHAPTRDIDVMWHLHMLHPRAYAEDCSRLFGEIFDHDGGFGKAEDELPQLIEVFNKTAALWEREYGEPYIAQQSENDGPINCWHDCQGRCWHACKSAAL